MSKNNDFFNDITSIVRSLADNTINMKRSLCDYINQQMERLLERMSFVRHEELDVLRETCTLLRLEVEALKAKIALLENNKDNTIR